METAFNQSLWGDEAFSAILSMRPLPEIIEIIARDTSPPLWNIWEWLVFNTLGTDEIYVRGLAFAFFLGTGFFAYKIGAFFFSKKTGALAALFTFLNPFFFIYAFEGRMYSIMAFGVAASMYYFFRIFYNEEVIRKRDKIGYVFFTLWALYSHHFAIFPLLMQGLWFSYEFILGKRKRAKLMFKLFLITGLGYTPWLLPLYNQAKMVGGGFWLGTPTLNDLRNLIYDYLAEGTKNNDLLLPFVKLPLYKASLYLVFVSFVLRKWWKNIKKTVFLLLWFLGPILAAWFISQKFTAVFFNRYLLYTIPAAMIVLVSARSKFSFIPITLLLLAFGFIDYNYFVNPAKLPFKELASYVTSTRKDGDFLVNWYSNGTHHIWETKYYKIPAPVYVPGGKDELPFFVGTALMEEEDITEKVPEAARLGVVTSGPIEEVSMPGYTEEETRTFGNLKFLWLKKDE